MPGREGGTVEWRSAVLPRYARMTRQAEALIAATYLAGTNTRRVKRALAALFKGAVGKDVVSRTWRKVKADWQNWNRRSLADEDIVRLILDGTVVKVRLDRRATNIVLLVVLGVRRDGQKVLLAVRNMGGKSEAAWRAVLDDLLSRGLRTPELLLIDGGAGLERALAALWPEVPTQRCTVHKHRNLLAHAPQALHEEITADYTDMIYAESSAEVTRRRRLFLAKWRLKCPAVAASLEEAGERLFTFTRLPLPANGDRPGPRMPSSACTRSSSAGSRPRPCCRRPRPPPCCSGRCSHPGRSPCAKSTAGRASASRLPQCRLISSPDASILTEPETPPQQFPHHPRHHPDVRLLPTYRPNSPVERLTLTVAMTHCAVCPPTQHLRLWPGRNELNGTISDHNCGS